MEKEEVIAKLSNTKVYVDGKSKKIQEKLFDLGFSWKTFKKEVANEDAPFLYIYSDSYLLSGMDMTYFKNNKFMELKVDDILSMKIDKECDFKPFDKVLVRDNSMEKWSADSFSYISEGNFKFCTVGNYWRYCIPFEGNEHLIGTSDSPDND